MKAAIVTGASSGIGEATAQALCEAGFGVVLAARSGDKLAALADKLAALGHTAHVCVVDVRNRADMKAVAKHALEAFGRIDLLVNNAGIMPLSYMKNLHEDEWERAIDVNIKGMLNGVGAVLPAMLAQKSGHIINVSSVAAQVVFPGSAVYSGTKFAIDAISQGLRIELSREHGIRVTIVRPGGTESNLGSTITDTEVFGWLGAQPGVEGMLAACDIANAIVYAATQPAGVSCNEITVRPTTHPF
jgi:NADP-dependent 3-hydroxy acid dehydrogenase YdfG